MPANNDTKTLIGEAATLNGLIDQSLTDIRDSDALEIGSYALYENDSIESVDFPSARSVGDYAFTGCNSLTSASLDSATAIGGYAFNGCGSLTSVNLPSAVGISNYTFYNCSSLASVSLPSVTSISNWAFNYCSNLSVVDLGLAPTIAGNAFDNCSRFSHLIIRGTPTNTVLNNSNPPVYIRYGNGVVYVPEELVSTYKNHSNWWACTIMPISAYPAAAYGGITDSWAEIIAAEDNGSYVNKYHVGDKKLVSVNGSNRFFTIIGIDKDDLADDSGKAKITWMMHNGALQYAMNSTQTSQGGWAASELRTTLNSNVLATLPSDLQGYIKSVKKTYYVYESSSTMMCNDKIWIPSIRETRGEGSARENSGPIYSDVKDWRTFTSSSSTSGTSYMFMRTAVGDGSFAGDSGSSTIITSVGANSRAYIRPCFCT